MKYKTFRTREKELYQTVKKPIKTSTSKTLDKIRNCKINRLKKICPEIIKYEN